MSLTITLLLLGLGSGAAIALTALGLVLMYRSTGVLNFATGSVGMVCSFVFWELTREEGWSALPAGIASVMLGGLLGFASYYLVIIFPKDVSNIMKVVATLGILLVLGAATQMRYGPNPLVVDDFYPSGTIDFTDEISIPVSRLILVALAISLTAVLWWIYGKTTFGLATTAAAENTRKLAAMGWGISTIGMINWTIGGALAGLAGVLLAPIAGGVSLTSGTQLTVTVLAAALIGGLRSFTLTLLGGFLIGMMQSLLLVQDLGVEGLADSMPFFIIVAVIIFRGRGLPLRDFVGERLPAVGTGVIRWPGVLFGVVAVVLLIGPILEDSATRSLTSSLLSAILLLSFVVLLGFAGQMSLAQVSLASMGGLIAARLYTDLDWPFALAMLVGALGAVPIGVLVGLPSARTRGVSLAIATLGLAVAIQAMIFDNNDIAGGSQGIQITTDGSLPIFGIDFGSFFDPNRYAYLALGFLVVIALAVANLRRSRMGRRMIAVRNNERAASALGINVITTKLWAFAIAAAIAGVSGVLESFRGAAATFDLLTVVDNITAIGYVVIGGVGSIVGALLGGVIEPGGAGNLILETLLGISPLTMSLIGGALLVFSISRTSDGIAMKMAAGPFSRLRRKFTDIDAWLATCPDDEALPARNMTLEARGIHVQFGSVVAVGGVDLTVRPGEIVGVVGANGAGKTTLIDAVTGFVDCEGTVTLGGTDLTELSTHQRVGVGLARSWQSLELIEDLTVLENLQVASDTTSWWSPIVDLARPKKPAPTPAMVRAIEELGLREHLESKPEQLSTGQRKRVALARAIATAPAVLLLDEPCSGLDQEERDEVARLVDQLAREWQIGVMLIEHDVHLVRRLADRVVALDFGEVIAEGEPENTLSDPRVAVAFLGEDPDENDEELAGEIDGAVADSEPVDGLTGERPDDDQLTGERSTGRASSEPEPDRVSMPIEEASR